jgi:hypothetical protein
MPVYIQIILIVIAIVIFYFVMLYIAGLGIRRLCFKIISEMEEANAFNAARAIELPEGRRNFFRVGTGNLRPRALTVLLTEGIIVKAGGGRYYLNKEKLAEMKSKLTTR